MTIKFLIFSILLLPTMVWGADLRGRLGVGLSNQLANDIPAVSMKIQQSKTFALGGLVGFKANEDTTLYGLGVKFYRIIFDEPQLSFYFSGLFATENYLNAKDKTENGFQIDGTFGSEFHFQGLESLGFSLEFGVSVRDAEATGGTSIQTLGENFLKAAVHFYL